MAASTARNKRDERAPEAARDAARAERKGDREHQQRHDGAVGRGADRVGGDEPEHPLRRGGRGRAVPPAGHADAQRRPRPPASIGRRANTAGMTAAASAAVTVSSTTKSTPARHPARPSARPSSWPAMLTTSFETTSGRIVIRIALIHSVPATIVRQAEPTGGTRRGPRRGGDCGARRRARRPGRSGPLRRPRLMPPAPSGARGHRRGLEPEAPTETLKSRGLW